MLIKIPVTKISEKTVSKDDLKLVLNGKADNFIPARKGTIARYLLEKWVNDEM